MMLVKTRVAPSAIEGLGLFADQDIPAGTPVWRFWPGLDQLVEPGFIAALPPLLREFCLRYGYLHTRTGLYVLCGDDARYMNHSTTPNTAGTYPEGEPEGMGHRPPRHRARRGAHLRLHDVRRRGGRELAGGA